MRLEAAKTEPMATIQTLDDIGIKLDDFEPEPLGANPHQRKLAYPVRLRQRCA
jgi:hypothetical protein